MARIMVLDDDEPTLAAMQAVLESAGHTVFVDAGGQGVAQRVMLKRPDILVTDVFMPEEDGIAVINAVRDAGDTFPIIAISGVDVKGVDYLRIAQELGANTVLHKPIKAGEFLKVVERLLSSQ